METYIVRYAPLNLNGDIIPDFKTVKILSNSTDANYIKQEFEKRCNLANISLQNYKGVAIIVKTLNDFLEELPVDTIYSNEEGIIL